MSAETADRLRALARDHADGRSSLETYRRLRAQLLDNLVVAADEAAPDATQPRPAPQPGEVTQPRAAAARAAAERTEPAPVGNGARAGRVTGYVAVGLILALAVVFLVWRQHSRGLAPSAAATASSGAGTGESDQTDPLRGLLEPLLQNPDWSDSRLVALNQALLEAGRARLDAARNTDWFAAFVESVRSRLLQQQALAGAPLTPDNSPLAALAETLGIDLAAPAQPAAAAAQLQSGAPDHVPAASAQQPERAPGAAGAKAAPAGKSESASARAQASGSASTAPASPARHVAGDTVPPRAEPVAAQPATAEPAAAQPAGSQAVNPGSASGPAGPQNVAAKTSAPHEYPACAAALSQVRRNFCQDFLASGAAAPLLAVIPSGSFMMGNGELAVEGPVHRVTLAYEFAMSVYEVSQSEFQLYCRTTGKACPRQPWTRSDDPVVNVSWHDAQDYARWLSLATRQRYRLPTEAEWEYAARAGAQGLYPSGDSLSPTDAYFSMGAILTAPAPRSMRFNANAWHLMHMVGNAREWVADAWNPSFSGAPADGSARTQGEAGSKVVRGGCYADQAIKLRLTTREPLPADTRDPCTGIRLVREIR